MHVQGDTGSVVGRMTVGRLVATALALTLCLLPSSLGANGERVISLYNVHTKETLQIAYKRNGRYIPTALKQLNWHLRDWRRNKANRIDPKLIDLVWEVHAELGSRMPAHVISGYRSPATNSMLRKTRGGQAKRSQHMLGKAMDVRFPDIPVRRLRYSALLREQGGVGYYPTSATPFVHLDTARVRHWPRMNRQELALLFPSGRTLHRPSNGGPITRHDALAARSSNPSLARRVAAFHVNRRNGPVGGAPATRVAAMTRPSPQLVGRPKLVARPQQVANPVRAAEREIVGAGNWIATARPARRRRVAEAKTVPGARAASLPTQRPMTDPAPLPFRAARAGISSVDRSGLKQLASAIFESSSESRDSAESTLAPQPFIRKGTSDHSGQNDWVTAPQYDEEHPEELYYRPFPIAPFITDTASADDKALQHLTHPDADKTLELLVADGEVDRPLQLRPGLQVANLLWSQRFGHPDDRGAGQVRPRSNEKSPDTKNQLASTWLGRRLVQLAGY